MRIPSSFLILVLLGSLAVQAAEGTLSGVVRDPSGATVPRARITVALQGDERREFAVTKDTGEFFLSPLPEGLYTVTVEKAGFAQNRQAGIEVSAARPARLEIVLNLGRISERVEVIGAFGFNITRPTPGADAPTRIRVGGNVQQTKLESQVRPVYPPGCKAEGVEGTVVLRAVISKEGTPLNLEPVNRLVDQRLVDAALEAVRQWRYKPTLLNGQPVEIVTEIQVNFTLMLQR